MIYRESVLDELVTALLMGLKDESSGRTAGDLLGCAGAILGEHLQADLVVTYELIPETGGVPRLPPLCWGTRRQADKTLAILANTAVTGALGDFIRHWQLHYETEAISWCTPAVGAHKQTDYGQFIAAEGIESFIFLPLSHKKTKCGAIFLNYRRPISIEPQAQEILAACAMLVGDRLAQVRRQGNRPRGREKQQAIAHTLYGGTAVLFKGQLDVLQAEIRQTWGAEIPPNVMAQLEAVKHTIFEVMRNLVIDAAGDLLVDLNNMSLAKALNTTAAALRRTGPAGHRTVIEIPLIPAVIERQPPALRQLLYALVLELMGNAIKHGGPAPYINVDLSFAGHHIYIQVIDHGQGFDLAERPFSQYGLGFWSAYIQQHLDGAFRVASQPGYGTIISARIPIMP